MATATNRKTSRTKSVNKSVNTSELRDLVTRRRKSSYPTDARTERQYWLRQIQTLLGENL